MKIYFTAPLYQRDENLKYYKSIISAIEKSGHEVIEDTLTGDIEKVLNQSEDDFRLYYKKWMGYLKKMDACVAEISFPCTANIGFEIASILNLGKPVVALYRIGSDPIFISPEFSKKMIKVGYNTDTIHDVLKYAFEEVEQKLFRRFTMNLPAEIDMFLEQQAKKNNKSRSEFIRDLIKERMEKE